VERLGIIQGQRATWFCGGYLHEPFVHEQALRSGLEIGNRLVSKLATTSALPSAPVTEEPFSDFLNQVKMFSGLDPWALAELQLIAQPFSVEVGQTIFRQGDQADGLYVIKNGAVAVIRRMPGDESLRLATLGSGDVFGEAGLLDSGVRSASAVSIEPTDGFFVSAERFATLRADMRPAALLVMRRFTREVADRTRKAVDNIVGPTPQRRSNAAATDWPAVSTSERHALDVLTALPMLRKFKRPEVEQMSERLKWVRLAPSTVVAKAGDRAERCLIVLRGACVTTLPMSHGNEPFAIHGPGSLVGELPLIDGGVHFGDCVAREDTMAIVIEQSAFRELCDGQTSVEFKLFEAMTLSIVAQLRRANGIAARLAIGHRTESEFDGS
jgi:CRP-like cAMP-binding protein